MYDILRHSCNHQVGLVSTPPSLTPAEEEVGFPVDSPPSVNSTTPHSLNCPPPRVHKEEEEQRRRRQRIPLQNKINSRKDFHLLTTSVKKIHRNLSFRVQFLHVCKFGVLNFRVQWMSVQFLPTIYKFGIFLLVIF